MAKPASIETHAPLDELMLKMLAELISYFAYPLQDQVWPKELETELVVRSVAHTEFALMTMLVVLCLHAMLSTQ